MADHGRSRVSSFQVMTASMRAIVLDGPGPPEALTILDAPVLIPAPSWVLIKVMAFGVNRSELHTRLGLVKGVVYGGESADLSPQLPQGFLDSVTARKVVVPVGHVYRFEEIVQAHKDMEASTVGEKLVVTT